MMMIMIHSCFLLDKVASDEQDDTSTFADEDSDVAAERHRLRTAAAKTSPSFLSFKLKHSLLVIDLTKIYGRGFIAVNHVCIGIKPGECFGLLGNNGAGKTSVFQMLTGDSMISGGEAWVGALSIKMNIRKVWCARCIATQCRLSSQLNIHSLLVISKQ